MKVFLFNILIVACVICLIGLGSMLKCGFGSMGASKCGFRSCVGISFYGGLPMGCGEGTFGSGSKRYCGSAFVPTHGAA